MNRSPRWLLAAGATLALGLAAAPAATADSASTTTTSAASTTATTASPFAQSTAALADSFGIDQQFPVDEALQSAIDGSQYKCGPTEFNDYINGVFASMTPAEITFLGQHREMLSIPQYDSLLYGTTGDSRYALRSDYKQSLVKTFADVKRFWDIQSSDIQLMSMHGEDLGDPARVTKVLEAVYGASPAAAEADANEIAGAINSGMFEGGKNPLFTLNAFAFSAQGSKNPLIKDVPDKLVFGDGIIDALNAMGLGDVGPRAVMGHEFGHHVQYEDHLFTTTTLKGAEATRRTELMADAFGTYFAVHARGLALNAKRVLDVERTFYDVGDCQYASSGHHGTPLQREASSTWAANLANAARPQGHILPSLTLDALFENELPTLVAPTATTAS